MILKQVKGDVFKSEYKHIAFAANSEGINDAGFAGLVARRFWPDLAIIGPQALGTVLARTDAKAKRSFHALVVHSLGADGWAKTPQYIEECFGRIGIAPDETIATVLMGGGPVGQMMGADVEANLAAMQRVPNKLVVYSL